MYNLYTHLSLLQDAFTMLRPIYVLFVSFLICKTCIFVALLIYISIRYFEEEDDAPKLDYIPAPGSPGAYVSTEQQLDSDEEDPLDAYMAEINNQVFIIICIFMNLCYTNTE